MSGSIYDLRHAHATALLASGVHPKIVQERLGHASIQLTMDAYSHVMPGTQSQAWETISSTFCKTEKLTPPKTPPKAPR
ncbi:MAG: tyrosine-type recombinase/integrase [Vulcanimicrobiaceae bacterium]